MKYQFHPVAEVFPLMNDEELDQLAEDIKLFGQREPILLFENQIVDGRNRYLACEQRGITPIVVEYAGSAEELIQLAISLNLRRRHLSEAQRAMAAGQLANMRKGERTDLPSIEGRLSQSAAAEMLNVSVSSVERAVKIQKNGVIELIEQVESDEISLTEAAKIAEMPRGKQIRLLKRGREDRKKITTKLIEKTAVGINKKTRAVCLCCNPELEFNEKNLLVHLLKLSDRAPARMERYFTDSLEELQEEMGEGVAVETRNARILIEDAIRSGYRTKDEIKKRTGLDPLTVNTAIAVMLEYKIIVPKTQEGKTEVARGQRKEFFVMKDEVLSDETRNTELQEEISNKVVETQAKAVTLIEKAIRGGFQSREQIKMHTGLDTSSLNAGLTAMLKDKIISSKFEFVRKQKQEFFVMNESLPAEALPESECDQFNSFDLESAQVH
jgi:ParB-like chromosome segregation protein Spo0J